MKTLLNSLALFVMTTIAFNCLSQTTPDTTDEIFLTRLSNNDAQFKVSPLEPSRQGAFFSHLWWSGDNSYSFAHSPVHNHITPGQSGSVDLLMTDIITESYGTGGPPPLTYSFTTQSTGGEFKKSLGVDTFIHVQAYRNAVIGDTMYLIITYANPEDFMMPSGNIIIDLGTDDARVSSTLDGNNHYLPNNERWNGQNKTISFTDLDSAAERSILVPVFINPTDEKKLNIRVTYRHEFNTGTTDVIGKNYFPISATVAKSHDPNIMIEHSDVNTHCDYRGGNIHYTVKFQNEGTGPTEYVRVVCHFDDKVDLHSISGIIVPDFFQDSCRADSNIRMSYNKPVGAIHHIDYVNRTLTIEMHHLILESVKDLNVPFLETTRDQIEFDILVKDNYLFGPPVLSYAEIFFDRESAIVTNLAKTGCDVPISLDKGGGFQCEEPSFLCKYKWWFICGISLLLLILILLLLRKRKKRKVEELKEPKITK